MPCVVGMGLGQGSELITGTCVRLPLTVRWFSFVAFVTDIGLSSARVKQRPVLGPRQPCLHVSLTCGRSWTVCFSTSFWPSAGASSKVSSLPSILGEKHCRDGKEGACHREQCLQCTLQPPGGNREADQVSGNPESEVPAERKGHNKDSRVSRVAQLRQIDYLHIIGA